MSLILASIAPLALWLLLKNKTSYKAKFQAPISDGSKKAMRKLVPARAAGRQPFLSKKLKRVADQRMQSNYQYTKTYTNELGEKFLLKENVPLMPTRNYSMLDDQLLDRKQGHLVEPHHRGEVGNKYTEYPKTKMNRTIDWAFETNDQVDRNMNHMQKPGFMDMGGGPSGYEGKVNNTRVDPYMKKTTRGRKDGYQTAIGTRTAMGRTPRSKLNDYRRKYEYGDTFKQTLSSAYRPRVAPALEDYPAPRRAKRGMRNYRV